MRCITLLAALVWLVQSATAQDFDALSNELTSGDRDSRREAALELRELGAKALPALPALIKALGDDDEQVAGRALVTIARIGPAATDAIPALIEAMRPQRRRYDRQVIFRAADALGQIGRPAVEPLRKAIQSSSEGQRYGAAQALSLIGTDAEAAIPELIGALGDDESEVRKAAAEALASIGEPAVRPLVAKLDKPTAATIHAIGLMGKPAAGASSELLDLFDGKPELRSEIIAALGAVEAPFKQLREPFTVCLIDPSEEVRRAAASTLLGYRDPQKNALPAIKAWLADEDSNLRRQAAWVAGQFGGDAAELAPDLIRLLSRGDDTELVTAALGALGADASEAILKAVSQTPLDDLQKDEAHWARSILDTSGALAIPALEEGLESEHASMRFVALDSLAALGKITRPLIPKFRRATNDPESAVRLAALVALDSAGADPQRLIPILHRRCADESASVRAIAIRFLGDAQDADPGAFDLVNAALQDADGRVRLAAVIALEKFGGEAADSIARLQELAPQSDTETKLAIIKALRAIGTGATDALPLVKNSLNDDDAGIRGAAIAALVAIEPDGESLTEVLAKMLADTDRAVRHPAIEGLGQRGEDAASVAPQLFEMLDRPEDRMQALEALGRIRSRDVDLYLGALDNNEPRVRLFACEALGRIGKEAERAIPQLEKAKKDQYDFVRKRAEDAIRRIQR